MRVLSARPLTVLTGLLQLGSERLVALEAAVLLLLGLLLHVLGLSDDGVLKEDSGERREKGQRSANLDRSGGINDVVLGADGDVLDRLGGSAHVVRDGLADGLALLAEILGAVLCNERAVKSA